MNPKLSPPVGSCMSRVVICGPTGSNSRGCKPTAAWCLAWRSRRFICRLDGPFDVPLALFCPWLELRSPVVGVALFCRLLSRSVPVVRQLEAPPHVARHHGVRPAVQIRALHSRRFILNRKPGVVEETAEPLVVAIPLGVAEVTQSRRSAALLLDAVRQVRATDQMLQYVSVHRSICIICASSRKPHLAQ